MYRSLARSPLPQVKILVALFLMMETADFSVPPQPDKDLADRLDSERRNKRKLWTAQGVDKYKVRSDVQKIKEQNDRDLEKSRKRPRRFVSPRLERGEGVC